MEKEIKTWPELAIGLYDELTRRGAEIRYQFDDMQVGVPRTASPDAPVANWTVSGAMRVSTRNAES